MKKILLPLLLFIVVNSFGQYNESAPWMNSEQNKTKTSKTAFTDLSASFNSYWKNKDATKKGVGFKPFKRWEDHWQYYIMGDGNIATPSVMWKAWEEKQRMVKSDVSNWVSKGPFTTTQKQGQGRVNTFIVDPNNAQTFYVGAPSGGIWKSTDSGVNWTPLSDQIPQIGVSGIAIDPNDSKIIYIATGDDDSGDTYSVGVLKSTDGGTTWNKTGLDFSEKSRISNEIYIHPENSNILWVSTDDGFYKTTDAGENWEQTISFGIADFKLKPNDPNIIYAVSRSKFWKSTDGGDTFTNITSGLPEESPADNNEKPSRTVLDITPANPDVVYVLSVKKDNSFKGLYKSTDSGSTFTKSAQEDNFFDGAQAWYDLALTVSPVDENMVFIGEIAIWRSLDGGDTFERKTFGYTSEPVAYIHVDQHFLRYFNNKLYAGNDGGIYESADNGDSFTDLTETLNISQIYRIGTGRNSVNNIAGGLQDNGGFGYSNNTWNDYHGGDGMDCLVDINDPNIYYGFTQFGGSLNITYNGGATPGGRVTNAPSDETDSDDSGGNWVTPLISDTFGNIYAGYSKLYILIDNSWTALSDAVFGGDLTNIAVAASNNQIFYASRFNVLFKSIDGGATFEEIPFFFSNNISSIEINHQNSDIVYLSSGGYASGISNDIGAQGNNWKAYKSIDGGATWADITLNLPLEPQLVIKHQDQSPINDLYLGTTVGVYHINDDMTEWEVFDTNLPNVPVYDLEINTEEGVITAGTYGRGVWQSTIEVVKIATDISLQAINTNQTIQCGGISPIITIKNNGLNAFNAFDINYSIDDVPFTYSYNGSINSGQIKEIELPTNDNIDFGEHSLTVETVLVNDAFKTNNTLSANFITNSSGSAQYINTFGDINPDKWITQSIWAKDSPISTKFNGVLTNYYTTNARGNYQDEKTAFLFSPCYDLSILLNPVLKFDMVFDIELDWDVLYMEYSVNNGTSWNILGDADDPNWYNSDFIDPARPITVGKQWTGTDLEVKEYRYDLDALNNETNIIFRFVFKSDQAANGEGAGIDNFSINASAILAVDDFSKHNFILYPNPSSSVFYIQRPGIESMSIRVYDVTGRMIKETKGISVSHYGLDLSAMDSGLYFLKITEGKQQLSTTILKQ
jgi:photosystem II stability/assembly factor-like uncharacterized protein